MRWFGRGIAVVAAGLVGMAAAQGGPPSASGQNAAEVLSTVIVIGARGEVGASDLAGSIDLIDRSELQYEHVDDTLELFTKAPGVYFQRYNQGIINTDISIRGFAGDGNTPHAKLLIDGIPSHLNSGANELDQLFPLGIKSIQVFKGTSDPRYGAYNIAGNYSVATRDDVDGLEAEVTVGSYATYEGQGHAGFRTGRVRHNYFLGYRESEGYRDHTDLEKFVGSGSWFYDFTDDTSLGLIVRGSGYEGDAPGYLSARVAREQPRSSADFANQDGGKKRIQHYSLHFDTLLGERIDWSLKTYRQHFDRERWVRFSAAASLQNRVDDQWHSGALTTLRWPINDQWQLTFGADAAHQNNVEQRFGTVGQSRQRNPANVLRNWHYTFDTVGSYLQIEHEPTDAVRWNAAIRADRLDGDFAQFNAAGVRTTRNMFDFGTIVQPKVNLFVTPIDALTLFANYGRSFQHPFGADAFTAGSTSARDVSINDGGELGVKWQPLPEIELRLSYWRQDASDEFVTVDGTAQNVGETQRDGFELAAGWRPIETLHVWGNFGSIETSIEKTNDSDRAFVGNELRGIPQYTASFGVTYEVSSAWTVRLHVDSQGDYYLNEANLGGQFGDYTLVNLGADYTIGRSKVSLQLNNVFDRYYEYVFDFSQNGTDTIHSPGDGINGSLSIGFNF